RLEVEGGAAGLIIDARGRPLPLATTVKALAAQIPAWYAQATGDAPFEVPPEWLSEKTSEPDIPSVVDRRSAQDDLMPDASLFSETERTRPSRQRGSLFGRRGKANTSAPEAEPAAEGDPDDIRSLLS
ncbi:hypothetical protein B7486_78185, partial [cyanobacterium TDX16]